MRTSTWVIVVATVAAVAAGLYFLLRPSRADLLLVNGVVYKRVTDAADPTRKLDLNFDVDNVDMGQMLAAFPAALSRVAASFLGEGIPCLHLLLDLKVSNGAHPALFL